MSDPSATTVLFLGCGPNATSAATSEYEAIRARLRDCGRHELFDVRARFEVRAGQLPGLLMAATPRIVHFCAHGTADGELCLLDASGALVAADSEAICGVFASLNQHVRWVVLNACHSLALAEQLAEHVDAAIGMRGRVPPAAGASFAAAFYEALAYGQSLARAFELARLGVDLDGQLIDGEPVLCHGAAVDPTCVGHETATRHGPRELTLRAQVRERSVPVSPPVCERTRGSAPRSHRIRVINEEAQFVAELDADAGTTLRELVWQLRAHLAAVQLPPGQPRPTRDYEFYLFHDVEAEDPLDLDAKVADIVEQNESPTWNVAWWRKSKTRDG